MNKSTNPQLSFFLRPDWLSGFVRADGIRVDTLVQLVSGWADEDKRDEVIETLDRLAAIVQAPHPREGELDAAVELIEGTAGMDYAQLPLDAAAAVRLHNEVFDVAERLSRFGGGGKRSIPRQPGDERRAS